jgi:hypothetical protein
LTANETETTVKTQVVSGSPGVGKTRLGYEYAQKEKDKYPGGIYLFSLETRTAFHNSVRENLLNLELQPTGNIFLDFKHLQSQLATLPKSLLIYDNCNQLDIVDNYLPSGFMSTHVLVLTRRVDIQSQKLRYCNVIQLNQLDTESSIQLLLHLGSQSKPVSVEDFQANQPDKYQYACNIVGPEGLKGLPLAIVYMAVIQREHKKDLQQLDCMLKSDTSRDHFSVQPTLLSQWLRKYRLRRVQQKLEDELGIKTLSDLRLLTTDAISMSKLDDKDKRELSVAREDLLSFPSMGPWKFLLHTICSKNVLPKEILSACSLLPSQDIPNSILLAFAATNQDNFQNAMELITSSLLGTMTEVQSVKRLAIHPVVQDAILEFIIATETERGSTLSHLCRVLLKLLPSTSDVRKNCRLYDFSIRIYSVHLYHLATLVLDLPSMTSEERALLDFACLLSIRTRNPAVARPLCEGRLSNARKEGNQSALCIALAEAGRTHSIQRHKDEAIKLFSEAADLLEEAPVKRALKWWSEVMNEIAEGYRDLHQYDKYGAMKGKIRDVLEAADMKDTYYYAIALGAAGVGMYQRGEPSEAQQASIESLSILRQVLPEKHPEIASGMGLAGGWCI